jgi:putative addiction module CopG family antidote
MSLIGKARTWCVWALIVEAARVCHNGTDSMARPLEATDLPDDIARTAEAQVAAGHFASVEDVVRAGVEAIARLEQKRVAVRAALQEGELSGVFEGDPFASVRAELGLTRQ